MNEVAGRMNYNLKTRHGWTNLLRGIRYKVTGFIQWELRCAIADTFGRKI